MRWLGSKGKRDVSQIFRQSERGGFIPANFGCYNSLFRNNLETAVRARELRGLHPRTVLCGACLVGEQQVSPLRFPFLPEGEASVEMTGFIGPNDRVYWSK
jgi:hypothetical protein